MNGKQVAESLVASVVKGIEPGYRLGELRDAANAADGLFDLAEAGSEEERFFQDLAAGLRAAVVNLPPFVKGLRAYVLRPNGGRSEFIVDACERAFGGWVVKGHFPRESKPYIYPAEMLEAD